MEITKEKFLVRASGAGMLMTKKKGTGLTVLQQKVYDNLISKIVDQKKSLSESEKKTFETYKTKKKTEDQLSDSAKDFVFDIWLWVHKSVKYYVDSKYLEKGIYAEEHGISLITDVDKRFYIKNKIRKDNGVLTGEPDIIYTAEGKKRIVIDIKCSWDAKTFRKSKLSALYEWQGRVYMELFDCDEFHLKYCLVDCPPHILEYEIYKFKLKNNIIDEDIEENARKVTDFRRTLVYSDNPRFTKEERVKTFIVKRDDKKIIQLYDKIKVAAEYYKNIKLNGTDDE